RSRMGFLGDRRGIKKTIVEAIQITITRNRSRLRMNRKVTSLSLPWKKYYTPASGGRRAACWATQGHHISVMPSLQNPPKTRCQARRVGPDTVFSVFFNDHDLRHASPAGKDSHVARRACHVTVGKAEPAY